MTVPVFIQQTNGEFSATLMGWPELKCVRPSRAEAVAALQRELAQRLAAGELLDMKIQPVGVSGLAGRFKDDPALQEICDEIYRERDTQAAP